MPGFEFKTKECQICEQGYYRSFLGYSKCTKCYNFHTEAVFQSNFNCNIVSCKSKLYLNDNRCITLSSKIVESVSLFAIIALLIFVLLFILNGFVIMIMGRKRLKLNKKLKSFHTTVINHNNTQWNSILHQREESASKKHFAMEDLPYYVRRIYLSGRNEFCNPLVMEEIEDMDIEKSISLQFCNKFNFLA